MIEPLDVLDFHNLMARSYMILTDSGGMWEEVPSLGKPVLVLRNTHERQRDSRGTLKLIGKDIERIYMEFNRLLTICQRSMLLQRLAIRMGMGMLMKEYRRLKPNRISIENDRQQIKT